MDFLLEITGLAKGVFGLRATCRLVFEARHGGALVGVSAILRLSWSCMRETLDILDGGGA